MLQVLQAFAHGLKVGLKERLADVLRAYLALIDADADDSVTRDEIRVFAAKVPASLTGPSGGINEC